MTLTCVSVTSGNASIGKDLKAAKPPATKRIRPRTMNSGLFSAKETTRSIMDRPAPRWAAQAGALRIRALGGDEHLPFELLVAVDHRAADLDRAGARIDAIGNRLHGGLE